MDLDLVGHLLGLLDPQEKAQIDATLAAEPAARARLDRLRSNLAPLAACRDEFEPPIGLAERTIAFVAARSGRDATTPSRKSNLGIDRPVFAPSRWRRVDAVVAASVLILVGGLGMSGVGHMQKRYARVACENNLRGIGQALIGYSTAHRGEFPQVTDQPPDNYAGVFVPKLHASGYLPTGTLPPCPVAGPVPRAGGYAYSLGYRGHDGKLHGMTQDDRADAELLALMADMPVPASHGDGHNVLYIGGNVRYCTSPFAGVNGDNIFDNQNGQIAAGLDRWDTVLGDDQKSP